ncbi:MAG: hypothetical protein E6X23_20970 [Mixta calida]|uniref:hypothetical protein n=1 Tax=Mixta calida TaxID=665913 RepID=UPI00290B1058|nr:hypothetical protein [Mixta calida]MDU4943965.1 hypothetical protein [Mixta calida]
MSVKRYDPELEKDGGLGVPSLTMYAKHTGSWVEYKDYAALEETLAQRDAQIAELAAENLDLKQYVVDELKYLSPTTPATDAAANALRAEGVEMFGQYHNFSEKLFIQKEAAKFAAKLREGK